MFTENVTNITSIEGHEIFEINTVALVPLNNDNDSA